MSTHKTECRRFPPRSPVLIQLGTGPWLIFIKEGINYELDILFNPNMTVFASKHIESN